MDTAVPIVDKVERETWREHEETWCSTTKLPLRDAAGNIIGTFGITRDVTKQMQAEAILARERDLLRTIIDNVPDLIFIKDRDGRFVTVNAAMLSALGVESEAEVIGKSDFDFMPDGRAAKYAADDQEVMRSGNQCLIMKSRLPRPTAVTRGC